jgi:3-keto-disaccharide hydrolase
MTTAAHVRLFAAGILAVLLSSCAPSGTATRGEGGPLDPVMGDWQGHRVTSGGQVIPLAVQAIALGEKKYRFVVQTAFDVRDTLSAMTFDGELDGSRLVVPDNPEWSIALENGSVSGRTNRPEAEHFELKHIVRLSPNLGARPPESAIVLFDGTSLAGWERRDVKQRQTPVGWSIKEGVMEVVPGTGDILTKQKFTDFQLHVEFRTPFMPSARGQARGNSGVYLQGRYEVQVLDSYGLKGEDNECGGIYKVGAPRVNMCAPPGQWQSYDVTFHAPRFDQEGKKVKDAVVTVVHNGVVIHQDLLIPGPTGGAIEEDLKLPAGILLQDHGNLVQYRNIWLVPLTR